MVAVPSPRATAHSPRYFNFWPRIVQIVLGANLPWPVEFAGLNQYTSAGGVALGYDGRGNLTASGPSAFGYSRLNELTSAPNGTGGTVSMTYDPKGRLTLYNPGTAIRMVYAGPNLVTETTATGTVLRRYVHGPGVDEPIVWYEGASNTDRRWLQADQLGSVAAISNASGTMLAINRFDEYGIPQVGNVGRFAYTGQTWFGEVGLYNYKARWYSPSLGRFMQTDPIGYKDQLNLYAYVGSDPINGVDPMGTEVRYPDDEIEAAILISSVAEVVAIDPEFAARYGELNRSENVHEIRLPVGNERTNTQAVVSVDAYNGKGTGTVVTVDPRVSTPDINTDGTRVEVSGNAAVAHELIEHAFDADRGTWTKDIDPVTGQNQDEVDALRIENRYQERANEKLRDHP